MTRKPRKPKPLKLGILTVLVDPLSWAGVKFCIYSRTYSLRAMEARRIAKKLTECADWLTSQKGKRG